MIPRLGTDRDRLEQALRDGPIVRSALGTSRTDPVAGTPPDVQGDAPPYLDDNVQFTVFRPRSVQARRWYPLPAFAHLGERPADAGENEEDPLVVVRREAEQMLGPESRDYQERGEDSGHAVPREGEITFVPEIPGVDFNPRSQTFRWVESVHRTHFRLRASDALAGQTARGRMTVFLGAILLAEINLSFAVRRSSTAASDEPPRDLASVKPFAKIFASYSHRDVAIVEQFERYATAIGDRYLRDWTDLRAGEVWSEALEQLIDQANVFQLFWSFNATRSAFVRNEWRYALGLNRERFIRPFCWQDPSPSPPPELAHVHFKSIALREAVASHAAPELDAPALPAPPAPTRAPAAARPFDTEDSLGADTTMGPGSDMPLPPPPPSAYRPQRSQSSAYRPRRSQAWRAARWLGLVAGLVLVTGTSLLMMNVDRWSTAQPPPPMPPPPSIPLTGIFRVTTEVIEITDDQGNVRELPASPTSRILELPPGHYTILLRDTSASDGVSICEIEVRPGTVAVCGAHTDDRPE